MYWRWWMLRLLSPRDWVACRLASLWTTFCEHSYPWCAWWRHPCSRWRRYSERGSSQFGVLWEDSRWWKPKKGPIWMWFSSWRCTSVLRKNDNRREMLIRMWNKFATVFSESELINDWDCRRLPNTIYTHSAKLGSAINWNGLPKIATIVLQPTQESNVHYTMSTWSAMSLGSCDG